ncbi:molybdopterin molybdotransferase MoeA [Dyella sp. GSA-30]|uniref:molybdopterin molybdotransferase MoeA n=1 Tax=Dyella sp. GSA-30 TaxID=2994496 RepID=UPI0024930ACD|nr:molybdopterin molybdotransferase MoeA [Dyella sp. GSA-30]BDU21432.1 molybdopterin molybdenumtransferase MoeA [Dyella sp. GSA-30]
MEGPISVAAAEALIEAHMPRFATERIPLALAQGRVLRQDIRADRDQPPFDRVMMDGIAIRHEVSLARYRIAGTQLAGETAMTLATTGDCLEVMTGAMLPQGADTVVPVESLRKSEGYANLTAGAVNAVGQFVHRRGSDCREGDLLLSPGRMLRAPEIAVLATNGIADVEVSRLPAIAVVSTGDELVDIDAQPEPWQIRRSNDHAIAAALRDAHFGEVSVHHVTDERKRILGLLDELLRHRDVIVLCGGVSMGQRDYIPSALETLGVKQVFHKIAQRPGKPMWFGIAPGDKPVFALPGNPVSALVCTLRYVLPALRAASGMPASRPRAVTLAAPLTTHASLTCFIPVALEDGDDGRLMAQPVPSATSGDFASLVRTDGIIELPPNASPFEAGFTAPFRAWS